MTGSEALRIAKAALRLVEAERRRSDARRRLNGLGRSDADAAEIETMQSAVRSCGAQVGGYRRGLRKACMPVLLAGVERPKIRDFRNQE